MPYPPPPPQSETELLERAQHLAGQTLAQLAAQAAIAVPPDLRRNKGWVGQLIERHLGADAASLAEPDFRALGVELKTLPIDRGGNPRESTYVCTTPLDRGLSCHWEESWLQRKLARVLWIPVEADPGIPLSARRVGAPLLWSPDSSEEALLRRDWEELMEMVQMGGLEQLSAKMGEVLQIRPKAAHSRVRCRAIGDDGRPIDTNPRGFYLRSGFTRAILKKHYAGGRQP